MKLKKFICVIGHESGTEESRVIVARDRESLEEKLRAEGVTIRSIREDLRIGGGLTALIFFCFFLGPAAPFLDTAFIMLHGVLFFSLVWVLGSWKLNPSKMAVPALLVFLLFTYVIGIHTKFFLDLQKVQLEGEPVLKALDGFHAKYSRYPKDLDQLPPDFINQIPDKPFRFEYLLLENGHYSLLIRLHPFKVFYNASTQKWHPLMPT